MTGTKRSHSETEVDDAELIAAEAASLEAQLNGSRSYRHWRDRNEPQASSSALAMRQACPYSRHDKRVEAFELGWRLADVSTWDRVCGGRPCAIVQRPSRVQTEIQFGDGTRRIVAARLVGKTG